MSGTKCAIARRRPQDLHGAGQARLRQERPVRCAADRDPSSCDMRWFPAPVLGPSAQHGRCPDVRAVKDTAEAANQPLRILRRREAVSKTDRGTLRLGGGTYILCKSNPRRSGLGSGHHRRGRTRKRKWHCRTTTITSSVTFCRADAAKNYPIVSNGRRRSCGSAHCKHKWR